MTAATIAPVIPSTLRPGPLAGQPDRAGQPPRRRLPLARLAADRRGRSTVYGLATLDCHGRAAQTGVVRALGWSAGTRLDIRECGGLILITADRQGVFSLTMQGHLRLPSTVRRWCGLVTGDRVLLAADPDDGLLAVHPPAALDAMVTGYRELALAGDVP